MPRLHFAKRLQPVAPPDGFAFPGLTLGQVLTAACRVAPLLRSYVFDEHGQIRTRLAVFVDHDEVPREAALGRPLKANSDVFLLDRAPATGA